MLTQSIKWRLQAWHGFLLTVLVAGLMTGFYTYEKANRLNAVDAELQNELLPLLPRLAPPESRRPGGFPPLPRGGEPPPERRPQGGSAQLPDGFYYFAWSPRGERIASSTNAPDGIPIPPEAATGDNTKWRTRGGFRELTHVGNNKPRLVIGTSVAALQSGLNTLALVLAGIGLGIVATGFSIGWALVTRALKPIAEISSTAQAIAAGDLSLRINPSEAGSELGQLATVLNSTFARLDSAFAQQQQFTSDAAHELRTPVTVILTQIQSTLNKERSSAEYRETLEACLRSAQRMRRLIESLLELARFDAGQERLARVRFDLADVVRESADLLQPLAQKREVQLAVRLAAAPCTGDPERLAQVVTNLLSNAVKWSPDGGQVTLDLTACDGRATLVVKDEGAGIPEDDLPRIFERFYRADKARSNPTGSAGLGLAICKAIVEAHGGTIHAGRQPGEGAIFTVHLPLVS